MKRNNNIDILRTLSIIMIIIYHIYAVFNIKVNKIFDAFISLGGEVGVTSFFILSGISIYFSLNKDHTSFLKYLKKRAVRILPQYYISIIIVLFLTGGATYLAINQIPNLLSHLLLVHTLFYNYHGAISGVLWTIGVIWWFYILAYFIFKIFNKYPKTTVIISILITVLSKIAIFNFLEYKNLDNIYYFIYGRQLITALDNFIIGMYIGKIIIEDKEVKYKYINIIFATIILVLWMLVGSNTINYDLGIKMPIHQNNWFNYFYHTILALIIAYLFYYFTKIKFKDKFINKTLIYIARHQYGLYIWHLLIMYALANSPIVIWFLNHHPSCLYLVLLIMIVPICLLLDIIIDSYDYSKMLEKK